MRLNTQSENLAVLVLVLASTIWGLTWIPLKYLNAMGIEGLPLLLVTHSLLGTIMLFFIPGLSIYRQNYKSLLAIALAGGAAILCFTYALMYGDVIRVMVLFYLLPVWGVLGGTFFLGERTSPLRWFGVGLALGGAYFILGGSDIFRSRINLIDLLALLSGMSFAANNMFFRGVEGVPLVVKLSAMFWGCASLAALGVVFGVQSFPATLGFAPWFWTLLYGCSALLLANLGSQWAVTRMEAGKSSIILIIELVAALISALIIAGERLTMLEWFGCALIVSAALLEAKRPSHRVLANKSNT